MRLVDTFRPFLLALALAGPLAHPLARPLAAQSTTGRVVGRVVDAKTGAGIAAAGIQVVGTTLGTQSGVDGRFTVANVPAGPVSLLVRRIGYAPKTVTGLLLGAGATLEQDIALGQASVQLTAQVVTASQERGSVNAALDAQKTATNAVNAITAEQIARSPDGDAAQAVQRVSGVTVQDGKYVFVRGLGERYTTASLNGARIPSPEPERKVVPLDLFPSGLLQSITTIKTFTPDQPGDFSGAQVDIRTREFPARRQVTFSTSAGVNDRVTGAAMPWAPRASGELAGLTGSARNIPTVIARTNFMGAVGQDRYNQMVLAQRNVWSPRVGTGGGNASAGVSMGGAQVLGRRLGYLLSANYGYSSETRADERYAVGNAGPNGSVVPLTQLRGSTGRQSVLWGGLANLSTMVGAGSRLSFNGTLTRSADNEARQDRGFDENLADSITRSTLRYVERGVATANVQGEHQLGERQRTEWSAAYGYTTRREPDRSDVVYSQDPAGRFRILPSLDGARRLWFDLDEQNSVFQLSHQVYLGDVSRQRLLKVGAYARRTTRDADAPMYAFITRAPEAVTTLTPERIFAPDQACAGCALVNVQPIGQAGSYDANDNTGAGFAMLEWGVGRVRIIGGSRVERAQIEVNSTTQAGFGARARLDNVDVLPSLVVNARLTESQNLRLAATRTLARPEYRELAPVTFRDVLGGVSVTGNDRLVRTLIQNYDARWEWFPGAGEVISVGVFGKVFDRPIERIEQATSGAYQATFQNARRAVNYGLELEARRQLTWLGAFGEQLTGFTNVTLMRSEIRLDARQALTVTNTRRAMVGQAPYVVNTGLTWTSPSGAAGATLLYNVVGERITAAGVQPLPDIIERPRHVVDASVRLPLWQAVSVRVDARNLLDARYRFMQGDLEREGWNAGRVLSVGFSWRP